MIQGVILTMLLLLGSVAGQEPPQGSGDLAQAIQRHYDQVRDFTADFTHIYEGGVLRRKAVEHGRMAVRKPGKMRWTYTEPEEKVFVSDGRKLYSYVPADRQVYVATVPSDDQASTPALFLAGKGDLVRDFTAERVSPPDAPRGTVALKLTPRRPEREYESLVLVVDGGSYRLRQLVTEDRQGGKSTFVFENLKENTNIPDKTFVFSIPRGVDVITDAGR
jgi:outer membrane lipoprotein carrier protein